VPDVSLSTASAWHDTLALSRSHRLTSNAAAYLELALRRGLPLASRDQGQQSAARAEGVPPTAQLKAEEGSPQGKKCTLNGPWMTLVLFP
jgi:hypothetical protein